MEFYGVEALKNDELMAVLLGFGTAKASQILASIEPSRRYLIRTHKCITDAKDVYGELWKYRGRADITIIERLQDVSKLAGIELLDHVILTVDGYYSFSGEGLL